MTILLPCDCGVASVRVTRERAAPRMRSWQCVGVAMTTPCSHDSSFPVCSKNSAFSARCLKMMILEIPVWEMMHKTGQAE